MHAETRRRSQEFLVDCGARGETGGEPSPKAAIGCNRLQLTPLQPAYRAERAAGSSLSRETVTTVSALRFPAWFKFSICGGDKTWVAGVKLATASEPPARKPRTWGRRPSGVDPSHPSGVTCF